MMPKHAEEKATTAFHLITGLLAELGQRDRSLLDAMEDRLSRLREGVEHPDDRRELAQAIDVIQRLMPDDNPKKSAP